MSYTYTYTHIYVSGQQKSGIPEKLIVTKGRQDVGRGGVLLCCPLFSFYYKHEFPGLVFVRVCVCVCVV